MMEGVPMRDFVKLLSLGLLIVVASLGLSACGDDAKSQRGELRDVGEDAVLVPEDAGATDARRDAGGNDAQVDLDADIQGDHDADAQGQPDADAQGEPDAGVDCIDADGTCPSGCYVTTDNDCRLDCRNPSTWPPSWVAFEDEVLRLTNIKRASEQSCGGTPYPSVPPLTMNAKLREAARCHSLDMAVRDFFSHISPDGDSPLDRANTAGYAWSDLGENVAAGPPDPSVVVPGWMNSPPHCTGIMSSDLPEIGVGYAFEDPDSLRDYNHYWTQAFGRPR
jgi:uncharacterized protein YkwD